MKLKQTKTYLMLGLITGISSQTVLADKEEIIVSAKSNQTIHSVLATTHVFNQDDILLAQVKDVPALLDKLAGISMQDSGGRGSTTGVFVRGTSNSQIIVLIDGVRVGSATLGSAALNSFPIEAIERIEVLKGPFSGIYGADAAGGVVQLFTKKHDDHLGSVHLSYGSDTLVEGSITLHGGNHKHGFTVSLFEEDGKGIDRTSINTEGNEDIDGFEQSALSFSGKTTLSKNTIAELSVLYNDNSVEFDTLFGADPGSLTDTSSLNSALSIQSQANTHLQWAINMGYFEEDSDTASSFSSSFTTQRSSLGSEFNYSFSDNHTLTTGVDYYEEDIKSSTIFPVTKRDNLGAFAQLKSQFNQFSFVGSLRYDDNSAYGDNINGSVAFGAELSNSLRLSASYGTAFIAPSFSSLYFPSFGNPDLLPEESESYEISLISDYQRINWRVSAYRTNVDNLFSFSTETSLAANIGKARLQGMEMSVMAKLCDWDFDLNLDVLSAKNKITGAKLDDRAERTLNLAVTRNFAKFNLGFNVKFEENRFDIGGVRLPSYALFDVSANYHFTPKLTLSANIDNLFDKDYTVNLISATERYSTEGRQAKVTLRYQF